jgi:hypothetical protein
MGRLTFPWDFLGSYNTEAYAWWRDGSMLNPVEWMPQAWAGYPAAASLQNSAWYLPVGLAATFFTYNIHVATVVQVLHVAFGAAGVYVLARTWRLGRTTATLGLVAYFFLPTFYSNAQHVDIVRGAAWLPWLVLITSVRFPWRRWWAVPIGALIVWQAAVSIYPGVLIASCYCGLVWMAAQQIIFRPKMREFFIPLAGAALLGVLLSAAKYAPVLALRSTSQSIGADYFHFNLGIAGTAFYPYDPDWLPMDISMRPYFLPAIGFALLALTRFARLSKATVATALVAFALSMPFLPRNV